MVKKYIPLIAFLITALLFTFSQAYAYTEITDCTTITSPGEYRLVNDITRGWDVMVCIDIQSDDVVLDCQGYALNFIVGSPPNYYRGITIYGHSNITIKNCVINNWGTGIYVESGSYLILNNITAGTTKYGISLSGIDHSILSNIVVHDNVEGLYIFNGNYITVLDVVTDNNIYGGVIIEFSANSTASNIVANYGGVFVTYSTNVTVINVTSSYDLYGFYLLYSNNCSALNITANYNYDGGIHVEFSDENYFDGIVVENYVDEDYKRGIYVYYSSNNSFNNVRVYNSTRDGIYMEYYSTNNTFNNFYVSNIAGNGIYMSYYSNGNVFNDGVLENIGNNGVEMHSSSNNTFYKVRIKNSNNCGISLWDSGYNLFYNNIFMNRNNTCFGGVIYPNYWNTTLKRGKNILGGPFIGGNFWGRPDGKSILDELKYAIIDGIYGHPYDLLGDGTNVDYHPLARVMFVVPPIFKSLVGLGMGIAFIMGAITLLFGIDFFKTKNPFVAIVMAMIGLAVMLLMFAYLWEML